MLTPMRAFLGYEKKALTCGCDGGQREREKLQSEHLKMSLVRRGRCGDRQTGLDQVFQHAKQ